MSAEQGMADQRPLLLLFFHVCVVRVVVGAVVAVAAVACVAVVISRCANNLLYHIHFDN